MIPIAQAAPLYNLWNAPPGTVELVLKMLLGLAIGFGALFGLMALPSNLRRGVVALVVFLSGLFYVLYWLWPQPIARAEGTLPLNPIEGVGFWLEDALPNVANFTNILAAFLLGLGVYSILRIHTRRVARRQRDWPFSVTLLVSMALMVVFGYVNWYMRRFGPESSVLDDPRSWHFSNYASDLLFDGLLQQMDAAMFSLIAFFILSAAYRAFRIRSIEATILLAAALIVILSLMGAAAYQWDDQVIGPRTDFVANFKLNAIAGWLRDNVQTPSIRGIDFGIGIGALAMGLRLWLSLERQGPGA